MTPEQMDAIAASAKSRIARDLAGIMEVTVAGYARDGLLIFPDDMRERVARLLSDVWRDAMRKGGQPVIDDHKAYAFGHLETKDDEDRVFDEILQEFVEQYGAAKVQRISETTRRQMIELVQDGLREGLGVDGIVALLRDRIPALTRLRAAVIARTETHSASQYAQLGVARQARRPLDKVWVSAADPRTRDFGEGDGEVDSHNHRGMNGTRVAQEEYFFVPTKYGAKEPLLFPGDPNGTAGNIINCRCAMTFRRRRLTDAG